MVRNKEKNNLSLLVTSSVQRRTKRETGGSSFRCARALLDESLKEMLVFYGVDFCEMSHEFPAKGDNTRPCRHKPCELPTVESMLHSKKNNAISRRTSKTVEQIQTTAANMRLPARFTATDCKTTQCFKPSANDESKIS